MTTPPERSPLRFPAPIVRRAITREALRQRFNDGGYAERIQAGELRPTCLRDRIPSPPLPFEPVGTRSQKIEYRDVEGTLITTVHCYRRPNGTLGASGRVDPVKLFEGGILWVVARDPRS